MGWRAIYKNGEEKREETDGRPVQDGDDGKLLVIAQEDAGHTVAVDLINGIIHLEYDMLDYHDGQVDIVGSKIKFWICEETNIVGLLYGIKQEFVDYRDEYGRKRLNPDGTWAKVRNDIIIPIKWRPIWFTRMTNGDPTKIIGAQTTTPPDLGGRNVKKMVSIFSNGDIGID